MTDLTAIFMNLGIALGLGLLVGLQREHAAAARLAGIRTFPLVTILGTVCGLLSQSFGGWVVALGLMAVTALIVLGNTIEARSGIADPGLTTDVALLLMYAVGAYLPIGSREVAVTIGGGVAVLLHWKTLLHQTSSRLGENDFKEIMQFVLLSMVILPVLPDKAYGPYQVLNPHLIWLMVVLIVGINLGGYIAYKSLGETAGIALGGILGGMISSTATTASYSRRSALAPEGSRAAALVILIASSVVFLRILFIIAIVAPAFIQSAFPPMAIVAVFTAALSLGFWFLRRREPETMPSQANPSELKTALLFGLIFAVVLLASAAARERFGQQGLYVVGAISGLTDIDAIALSTAQFVETGKLPSDTGWRVILLACMSNLIFKSAVVMVLGHRRLLRAIVPVIAAIFLFILALIQFWP